MALARGFDIVWLLALSSALAISGCYRSSSGSSRGKGASTEDGTESEDQAVGSTGKSDDEGAVNRKDTNVDGNGNTVDSDEDTEDERDSGDLIEDVDGGNGSASDSFDSESENPSGDSEVDATTDDVLEMYGCTTTVPEEDFEATKKYPGPCADHFVRTPDSSSQPTEIRTVYVYDELGLLKAQESCRPEDGSLENQIVYTYNESGLLLEKTEKHCSPSCVYPDTRIYSTVYTYDEDERLLQEKLASLGYLITYTYDVNGRLIEKEFTGPFMSHDTTAYTYDGSGRLESAYEQSYSSYRGVAIQNDSETTFTYDGEGNLVKEQISDCDTDGEVWPPPEEIRCGPVYGEENYTYDERGNVLSIITKVRESLVFREEKSVYFEYDAYDNLLKKVIELDGTGLPYETTTYFYGCHSE